VGNTKIKDMIAEDLLKRLGIMNYSKKTSEYYIIEAYIMYKETDCVKLLNRLDNYKWNENDLKICERWQNER
jgi:hypothetical protein